MAGFHPNDNLTEFVRQLYAGINSFDYGEWPQPILLLVWQIPAGSEGGPRHDVHKKAATEFGASFAFGSGWNEAGEFGAASLPILFPRPAAF
jgi:tetrahydromethanopterin S-methyltransferase subunit E